jgi:hypothetical protein
MKQVRRIPQSGSVVSSVSRGYVSKVSCCAVMLWAVGMLTGCSHSLPYVSTGPDVDFEFADSARHQLTYIRAYEEGGELVVYGKVEHRHGDCAQEGHVELSVADGGGSPLWSGSAPLRRSSPKLHGWSGASFRSRIEGLVPGRSRLVVTFHEQGCLEPAAVGCRGQ